MDTLLKVILDLHFFNFDELQELFKKMVLVNKLESSVHGNNYVL